MSSFHTVAFISAALALPAVAGSARANGSVAPLAVLSPVGNIPVNAGGRGGPLVPDGNGGFFGTTEFGGVLGLGEVYQLVPPADSSGSWTRQTIYSFTGLADGSYPVGGVLRADAGVLFGVTTGTELGFTNVYTRPGAPPGDESGSVIYTLTPPVIAGGAWVQSTVMDMGTRALNGGLVRDGDGVIYGTYKMAANTSSGAVFRLYWQSTYSPAGWVSRPIVKFDDFVSGVSPQAGLTFGADGSLYGTTEQGGDANCDAGRGCGTVYRLVRQPDNTWTRSVLHAFHGGGDGDRPNGWPVVDATNQVFGSTQYGGVASDDCPRGCGTTFRIDAAGGFARKHVFCATPQAGPVHCPYGYLPLAGLARGDDGLLHGSVALGGKAGSGTAFAQDGGTGFATTDNFYGADGSEPAAPLARTGSGGLIGTNTGGRGNVATIYTVSP